MSTKITLPMDLGNLLAFPAMGSSVKHVSSCAFSRITEVGSKFIYSLLFLNQVGCSGYFSSFFQAFDVYKSEGGFAQHCLLRLCSLKESLWDQRQRDLIFSMFSKHLFVCLGIWNMQTGICMLIIISYADAKMRQENCGLVKAGQKETRNNV